MSNYHTSVLLQEAVNGLCVRTGGKYIDATIGAGGHTKAIIQKGGNVLGIDQDREAIAYTGATLSLEISSGKLQIVKGNFADIAKIAKEYKFTAVAGILFDLGVSGHQLDSAERGFSFLQEAPLDMRMDDTLTVSAKELVNGLHKGELIQLFTKYAQEPFAKRIAEKIITHREHGPIETTTELAAIVARVYPKGGHAIHPATKVFQALRIAVNDELVSLEKALGQALTLLQHKGRIAVISFHSLEDRIVKQTFLDWEAKGLGKIITKKPIRPGDEEIEKNKRSRSSKLRIFERE